MSFSPRPPSLHAENNADGSNQSLAKRQSRLSSERTYSVVMSMHISKPKTIWHHGLYRAKRIWRSLHRQRRSSAPSILSEPEMQQAPAVLQYDQQRNSSTPSIVRTTPSNRRHVLHVGPSSMPEETDLTERRRSVRYLLPAVVAIIPPPALSSIQSSPRASDITSSRTSRSTNATSSTISGRVNPLAAAAQRLGARPEPLNRTESLNHLDGVPKFPSASAGISGRVSRRQAHREASIFAPEVPRLAYIGRHSNLRDLTATLEMIGEEDTMANISFNAGALALLESRAQVNTAEQTQADFDAVLQWRRTSQFFNPASHSSQYPGQQPSYSQYRPRPNPLPSIMEQAVQPEAGPSTRRITSRPTPERSASSKGSESSAGVVTSDVPFCPSDVGRDNATGKRAADLHVQQNLDDARRGRYQPAITQAEADFVPDSLQPGTRPLIRESRYKYPLPSLPTEAEDTPAPSRSSSLKRKPLPPRPAAIYQDIAVQTEEERRPRPLKKRELFTKVILKTYYYE